MVDAGGGVLTCQRLDLAWADLAIGQLHGAITVAFGRAGCRLPRWARLTTVTSTTLFAFIRRNTCVIPSLVPRMPFRAHCSVNLLLDGDVDAGRKVDAHERVNGLRRGIDDVDQPLVCALLEVLPRVLVLMR